ncbi:DUF3124 domain-containing protein [Desulfoplanes formicivorans]|uniref:DUF3124 domain-containing protein n=1 Tax=Desulfoplanes formicivorans TaxID=1592317 RepID=A0A194AFR2_9BACT|nr:DUF3124 domain-containing protein [Desulfoplanes formicivorans]GAU08168.1 hypothetical protein DPF_0871 [Desulfoplanes formicivorans]
MLNVLFRSLFLCCLTLCITSSPARAEDALVTGGTVYVPIYSNIYHGPKARPFELMAILSIRNTDLQGSIRIVQADYHDSHGKLIKRHVGKNLILPPLGSADYTVPEQDKTGGAGANFIVTWESDQPVNEPIIQSLMISTRSSLGISFICPGKTIHVSP